jgi:hypothetical protein
MVLLIPAIPPGDHKPADARWLPSYTEPSASRGLRLDSFDPALREGLSAYDRRELERSIDLLDRDFLLIEEMSVRDVYLASALTWSGRHDEALEVFRRLSEEALPDPYRTRLLWTRYAALVGAGRRSAADSLRSRLNAGTAPSGP